MQDDRFPWTVTTYPADHSLMAECVRPGCGGVRYLPRSYLIEKVGDLPLLQIERRLRCVERPLSNKRGKACGGAMELAWVHKSGAPEANQASVSHSASLAAFADRMGGGRSR
jgi:hypothetical protein